MNIENIGLVAGLLTTGAFIPQVWKIWRSRQARDISYTTFGLFSFGVFLWLVYGLMLGAPSIILANGLTLLLALLVIVLKLFYERNSCEQSSPIAEN